MLNPDMPDQELRLHMGELTANEAHVARTAIRWANERWVNDGRDGCNSCGAPFDGHHSHCKWARK